MANLTHFKLINFNKSIQTKNISYQKISPIKLNITTKLLTTAKAILSTNYNKYKKFYPTRCHKYAQLAEMSMKNNAATFDYSKWSILLEPKIQENKHEKLFMLVGVFLKPDARDIRDAIRDTWGSRLIISSLKRYNIVV